MWLILTFNVGKPHGITLLNLLFHVAGCFVLPEWTEIFAWYNRFMTVSIRNNEEIMILLHNLKCHDFTVPMQVTHFNSCTVIQCNLFCETASIAMKLWSPRTGGLSLEVIFIKFNRAMSGKGSLRIICGQSLEWSLKTGFTVPRHVCWWFGSFCTLASLSTDTYIANIKHVTIKVLFCHLLLLRKNDSLNLK